MGIASMFSGFPNSQENSFNRNAGKLGINGTVGSSSTAGQTEQQLDTPRITVWLVDDNDHFCFVVGQVLNECGVMKCTGVFSSCELALKALQNEPDLPSVVLLDIGLPGMSGLDAIQKFKKISPSTHIIMLTVYDQDENIFKAIYEGASGYLLKSSTSNEIIPAIQAVVAGGAPMDPFVVRKVLKLILSQELQKGEYGLTSREKDILRLVISGLTMSQIADRLSVSYSTISTHFKNIHIKLQVHTRSEVIVKALKEQLL